jgi:Tol biopolymer transport system component
MAVWTADGRHIAFFSMGRTDSQNASGVYLKAADGEGHEEQLGSIRDRLFYPSCWSNDEKILVGIETPDFQKWDVGMLLLEGEHARKLLLHEEYGEAEPKISPDGKWMAYTSTESGRAEVYVRPFPERKTAFPSS